VIEIEERPTFGRRVQPVDLIVERDGEVAMHGLLPRHAAGGSSAVDREDRDAEPIREPLMLPVHPAPAQDLAAVGTAVGLQEDGHGSIRLAAVRDEQRGPETVRPELCEGRHRIDRVDDGPSIVGELHLAAVRAHDRDGRRDPVGGAGDAHQVGPPTPHVDPGLGAHLLRLGARRHAEDMPLDRAVEGVEPTRTCRRPRSRW
jgi:hypothetical protein